MKKIMVALSAIALAIAAQAGTVTWSNSTALIAAGTTETIASGTLQLLAVTAGTDVASVWESVKEGTFASVASATLAETGKIPSTNITLTNGTYDFYSILVDGDTFFFSAAKAGQSVTDLGAAKESFALKTQSNSGLINNADAGYVGAGWYNVPEPTSGLLLLLGMGALALRRKQA